jgi:hypothetical protein
MHALDSTPLNKQRKNTNMLPTPADQTGCLQHDCAELSHCAEPITMQTASPAAAGKMPKSACSSPTGAQVTKLLC